MGSRGNSVTIFGVSLLSIIIASSSGFSFDNNLQNNSVESIPEFATAFVQFASATHVLADATGSITDPINGVNTNLNGTLAVSGNVTAVNDLQDGAIKFELRPAGGGQGTAITSIFETITGPITAGNNRVLTSTLDLSAATVPTDGDYDIVLMYNDFPLGGLETTIDLATITITLDRTAPTITANIPTPDGPTDILGNNWYVTNSTSVTFTCADATSGVFSCQAPQAFPSDGRNQEFLGALVTDNAGNTATTDVTDIDVDTTPPTLTFNQTPDAPDGENNWFVSNVTLAYSCVDSTSFLVTTPVPATLTESANPQTTGTNCINGAGLESVLLFEDIFVDTSPPTLTLDQTPAAFDGSNGWFVTAVFRDYSCDDDTSGVATAPVDQTLNEGENQNSAAANCIDNAGNESIIPAVADFDVDTTDPSISLPADVDVENLISLNIDESDNTIEPTFDTAQSTGVPSGSLTYTMEATRNEGSLVQYTITSSDVTSGVGTFSCVSGGAQANVDGSSAVPGADSTADNGAGQEFPVGSTTVTCTSTDEAGNPDSDTVTFTVTDNTAPTVLGPFEVTRDNLDSLIITEATNTITPTINPTVDSDATEPRAYIIEALEVGGNNVLTTVKAFDLVEVTDFRCVATGLSDVIATPTGTDGEVTVSNGAGGQLFPITATTVTCTAKDAAGNHDDAGDDNDLGTTTTYDITVRDTTDPILLGPFEITHETVTAFAFSSLVNDVDNTGSTDTTFSTATPQDATEPRSYTIEAVKRLGVDVTHDVKAYDNVQVTDLRCIASSLADVIATPTGVAGEVVANTIAQTHPITDYNSEKTTVTCTAKDAAGNHDDAGDDNDEGITITFDITVEDTTPPLILSPEDPGVVNSIVGVLTPVNIDIGFGPAGGSFVADLVSENGLGDGTLGTISFGGDNRNDPTLTPECNETVLTCFEPLPDTIVTWSATDTAGKTGTDIQTVTINPTGSPIVIGYFENTASGPEVNTPVSVNLDDGRQVQVTDYRGNQDRTETEVLRIGLPDTFDLQSTSLADSSPGVHTALIETGPDTGVFRTQLAIVFEGGAGPSVDDAFIAIVPDFNPNAQVLEDDELNVTPTDTVTSTYTSAAITSVYDNYAIPQRSAFGAGSDTADGTANIGCIGCGNQIDIPLDDNTISVAPAFRVNDIADLIIRDTFYSDDTSDNSLIKAKLRVINDVSGDFFSGKLTEDYPDDQGALYPTAFFYLSENPTNKKAKTLHVEEGDTVTFQYWYDGGTATGDPSVSVTVDIIAPFSTGVSISSGVNFVAGSNCGPNDRDGDGLCDSWETSAGLFVNATYFLPCVSGVTLLDDPSGATVCPDPDRKDIYVEYDYMWHNEPSIEAINIAVTAFDQGRIKNPGGDLGQSSLVNPGVMLHMISSERMPLDDWVQYMPFATETTPEFPTIPVPGFHERKTFAISGAGSGDVGWFGEPWERAGNFEDDTPTGFTGEELITAKRQAFHYMMFIAEQSDNRGSSGTAEIGGNDVLISMADFTAESGSADEVGSTIVHELGHNLGLRHGGGDLNNYNCKPNYISVMNYAFQFDIDGLDRKVDFSRKNLVALDTTALIEETGIKRYWYPQHSESPVFWGETPVVQNSRYAGSLGESIITLTGIGVDWDGANGIEGPSSPKILPGITDFDEIDDCGPVSTILLGYDDWSNLDFNFRNNTQFSSGDSFHEPPASSTTLAEILSQVVNPAIKAAKALSDTPCGEAIEDILKNEIKPSITAPGKSRAEQQRGVQDDLKELSDGITDGTVDECTDFKAEAVQDIIRDTLIQLEGATTADLISDLNKEVINVGQNGVVHVTIFGKPGFDVNTLDVATFMLGPTFEGDATGALPLEEGKGKKKLPWVSLADKNEDGIPDLTTKYSQDDTLMDVGLNQVIRLSGSINDGTLFQSDNFVDVVRDETLPTVEIVLPVFTAPTAVPFALIDSITFEGTAEDTQGGDISANIVWSSDATGDFGTGASLLVSAATFGVGNHVISATITDGGNTSTDQILISIEGGSNLSTDVTLLDIEHIFQGGKSDDKHLRVTLTVVDISDGVTPVPNVEVSVEIFRDGGTIILEDKITDGSGQVTFDKKNAPEGDYEIVVLSVTGTVNTINWDDLQPDGATFTK